MNIELFDRLIRKYIKDGYKTMYIEMVGFKTLNVYQLSLYTGSECDCITFLVRRNAIKERYYLAVDKIVRFGFEIDVESNNEK